MNTQNTANELRTQHANEVKAYSAHVEEEIARVKHELQFLQPWMRRPRSSMVR